VRVTREIDRERTEVLPDGIPGEGELAVQTSDRQTLFGVAADGEKIPVGGPRLVIVSSGGAPQQSGPTRYDLYVVGDRLIYTFVFRLLPGVTFTRTLMDLNVDSNAKGVPYDQLPDDMKRQADQSQNNLSVTFGQTQAVPPPRP